MKDIIVCTSDDNQTQIEVQFENETVWLSQSQISQLFQRDRTVITKHINTVFKEGELDKKSNVQKMHIANSDKPVDFYNLDVIISIGYRIKSKQGTQFRLWATERLKDYLVKGYAFNEKRLKEAENKFPELKQTVQLLENVVKAKEINDEEAQGLLKVLSDYAFALDILDQYDHQTLKIATNNTKELFKISYWEAVKAIKGLKTKFGGSNLFGNEKDDSFKSSLETIYQTFDGIDLYPSVQEKAAHLLYFVTKKNRSFSICLVSGS